MGDIEAGLNTNVFVLIVFAVISCVILHFLITTIFGRKKKEALEGESESNTNAPTESVSETAVAESRTSSKSKKRAPWKGKSEYSHQWLLKSLKGHPGNVLAMDFSSNGKFMAATCDDTTVTTVDSASIESRRRKPRDRRRSSGWTSPPPPPPPRIPTEELAAALKPHIISSQRMWAMGYPLEIEPNSTKAIVYVNPPPRSRPLPFTSWDVNAPEFVPGGSLNDSGRGSWGSSPRSDSDEETDAVEHSCVRCDKIFRMTRDGEYLKEEACFYHWGRVTTDSVYSCCSVLVGTRGCVSSRCHVWNGTRPGMNGPLEGYVRARSPRGGVYALDAEMCYTTAGLELASIAVIAADGHLVYRSLVQPSAPVVDYNTRFSGIRARDITSKTKTLRNVQNDILGFIGTDTILIGHALDNDLRALKLIHTCVVDTCALYPHARGFPLRRSLRALSEEILGRKVQRGCHSPTEDARAALDLVLVKVHSERDAAAASAEASRPVYVSTTHGASYNYTQSNEHRVVRPPMYRVSNHLAVLQPYDPLISAA